MSNKIDLTAPISILFEKDPVINYVSVGNATNFSISADGSSSLGMTGVVTDTSTFDSGYYGHYWNWWEPYNDYHFHTYNWHTDSSKFEQAFKISRKLMEKKLVRPMKTVEDFFKLMDGIVEALKEF